jgi:hypothetical protein
MMKNDVYNTLANFSVNNIIQDSLRLAGMIIMSTGVIIGAMGRWARGDYYAHNELKLQKRLGFAFVRHPNYFQYYCGFIGLPLVSLHLFTIILPALGLYSYYIIAREEENRLLLEFGLEYQNYQQRVGMFFPKISSLTMRRKPYSLPIVLWSAKIPKHKLIAYPIKGYHIMNKNWIERLIQFIDEYYLIRKNRILHPAHPFYSASGNLGNNDHLIYDQIMR